MPTAIQLRAEPWYGREFAPPTIVALGKAVREHFGLSVYDIGTKGNELHLRGYHRSRAWVKNSAYCTNRSYSIKETAGNREGGNDNWVCALDISAPPQVLLPMCQRLDRAVRAGRFEKVTEWYGNFDGDKRVDGYNNIADRAASSDSSHLTHCHISFDRGRAGEDHADLLAVLVGAEQPTTVEEDGMYLTSFTDEGGYVYGVPGITIDNLPVLVPLTDWARCQQWIAAGMRHVEAGVPLNRAHWHITETDAWPDTAPAPSVGGVDVAALAAALIADPGLKAALEQAAFVGAQKAERE